MTEKFGDWLDNFGILASWTCALHCLLMPFLLGIIPLLGLSFLLTETAERSLIAISFILAMLSLFPAYFKQHGKLRSVFLAVAGLSLIIVTHLFFEDSFFTKASFLIVGATLVSSAHLLNRYLCRNCESCIE